MDTKKELQEYLHNEDLANQIKKGNYSKILLKKQRGGVQITTQGNIERQRVDAKREAKAKKRPPVVVKASTRADDRHLKQCVDKVVKFYDLLISDKRPYPRMIEMSIDIEVVIPYGTPDHVKMQLQRTAAKDIDKGPANKIIEFWTRELVAKDFHVRKIEKEGNKKWALIVSPNQTFIDASQTNA